jgi:Arc/MetJ-type ribon-helix-helix transcriptional regulator
MELTITPEVGALIQNELTKGRFASHNELIATALLVLSENTPRDLIGLDAAIQEGIDSADHGDLYSESEARAHLASLRTGS